MIAATCLFYTSCSKQVQKPETGSETYKKTVSDFYVSLAAMQADQALFAIEKMDSLSQKYTDEAAFWANLGVFAMRQGNFEDAEKQFKKAIDRDPVNGNIYFLAGILESRRGSVDASIRYLRKAAEKSPSNIKIAYALAEELERQGSEENADEVFSILQSIIEKQPDNLAVLLEIVRTSVKWEKRAPLEQAMNRLSNKAEQWPEEIRRQFEEIKSTILEPSGSNLTFQLAFLRNNLNQLTQFQSNLAAVQIPPNQVGFFITTFSWLPQPGISVAEADKDLTFEPSRKEADQKAEWVRAVALFDNGDIDEIAINDGEAVINGDKNISFPGKARSKYAVETLDYNYDFLNDLAFAGSAGFRLYRQQEDSTFTDVTLSMNLPESTLKKPYYGVWSRDIDLDGDLDLVLGPVTGSVSVLRNNGDGSFTEMDVFKSVNAARDFVWADFDGDADPDAMLLDQSGTVHLFLNERSARFTLSQNLPQHTGVMDIEVADVDNDGVFDLLVWNSSGIFKICYNQNTGAWESQKIVNLPATLNISEMEWASLYSVDLDNNGGNDLIISTPKQAGYWLNNENLQIESSFRDLPANILDIADLNEDTRLDLVTLNSNGIIQEQINRGSKPYIARMIRPRASASLGDQRINSFGIGGEIETRSGLLYQKKLISQPWVHLGLGTYKEADFLRIIWPNGSTQAEFAELGGYDSKIFNEQILKGSCPWVFTYNGKEMEFVTDFLWKTSLGLRINMQGPSDVLHSIDWIKIDGDQLKPRNDVYDVRITADLWESHFFDQVSLMAVDHPKGTEVFVDERFTTPPKPSELYTVNEPKQVAKAMDQDGKDVTSKIREYDDEYVDSFGLTKYQGVAKEHYLEVELGNDVPSDQPVRLIASGWVYPTDTSVNIAISQGKQSAPHPLRLEVPDGRGGWKVVREDIGFPSGKSKTMLIDVTDIFEPGTEHRLRLSTNMEIYWNQIRWAVERTNAKVQRKKITFSNAELRYRGFSKVERAGRFIPEQPNYQQVSGTTPKWHDLEGFYTRYGEVDELVQQTDDRYVIMNAGDELAFEFPVLPAPAVGMSRDFVLIGDGWLKDGDFNTGFSKTLRPLPYHGLNDYSKAPVPLRDDPAFRKHPEDWVNFHTRYVSPGGFRSALIFDK